MSSDSKDRRPIASLRAAAVDNHRRTAKRDRSYSPYHAYSNGYRDEEQRDRRSSSRSPSRRRRASMSGRSPRPSCRRSPRSCRSRSRTRSEECDDRRCCQPRQVADREADKGDMSEDEEEFLVRIDRDGDLFKCAQCDSLLSSPVYECGDGHVTCATCHGSANGEEGDAECRRCGSKEYNRSRAVAGWLRSIRFSCRNNVYGCPAFRARYEMDAHELSCCYAPCFCPAARRCDFHGGPADALVRHLTARHGWSVVDIRYDQPFHVRVHSTRSVLRAEDGALFHLSTAWEHGGTALSMICIRPDNAAEAEFTYEVKTQPAAGLQHRLQMQSTVWCTSLRYERADANPVRVTVPDDMFPLDGPQRNSVEVCVHKVAPAGARSS